MIDVYAIQLNFDQQFPPSLFEKLSSLVPLEKKNRLMRFYREEDRLRGLYGELLLRYAIIQRIACSNSQIQFRTNDYGKPELIGDNPVQFNLSHSGIWVVTAIDENPVGIDVEEIQPIDLDISENYFSPEEHRDLLAKEDKFDYFFTLWALKESYIKILGKGLSHPLNAFSISFLSPQEIILQVEGRRIKDICFKMYPIHPQYKMAVCATHDQIPAQVKHISQKQLTHFFFPIGY